MFFSRRVTTAHGFEARVATHAILDPRLRLHVVDNAGVVTEDALATRAFQRLGGLARPGITVVLDGEARLRAWDARGHVQERVLAAGDACVLGERGAVSMRQQGARYRSVFFEWEPARFGGASKPALDSFALSASGHTHLARLAAALTGPVPPAPEVVLADLLAVLRAEGLPLDAARPRDLHAPPTPRDALLARALDASLSDLDARPAVVDLERALGLSARQLARAIADFHARYAFNAGGWRDALLRRRLLVASAFATARDATTERVARSVGYGAPAALCRALSEASLPTVGAIRDEVRRLA